MTFPFAFSALLSPIEAGAQTQAGGGGGEKHRTLLLQAERDFARGAFKEGLTAADEALFIAEAAEGPLRIAAALVVRRNLLLAGGDADAAAGAFERVVTESRSIE